MPEAIGCKRVSNTPSKSLLLCGDLRKAVPGKGRRKAKTSTKLRQNFKLRSTVSPVLLVATTIPDIVSDLLKPPADYFNTLGLPEWLIHWGHPGNMAVVLFAMGGYGAAYLGWQIRISDDGETVLKAKELHPKLALGMAIFFALGATGGLMSLLMQGQPILSSPHATTGLVGLALLLVQASLPALFSNGPSVRTAHAYLGSLIMALFLVHAVLGLKLGLSI